MKALLLIAMISLVPANGHEFLGFNNKSTAENNFVGVHKNIFVLYPSMAIKTAFIAAASIVERPEQQGGANYAEANLNLVGEQSVFGRFRHIPLYAQIGLVMVLGLGAMGLGPIGLGRLFPVGGDRRQLWSGLFFGFVGLLSYGLICCVVFLG